MTIVKPKQENLLVRLTMMAMLALAMLFFAGTHADAAEEKPTSATQIVNPGGTNSDNWNADKVRVSKTIEGTDIENVFDITLKVETQQSIEEIYKDPDMAVVLVFDLSNSMNETLGGSTKGEGAITAAKAFVDEFQKVTNGTASKIGCVGFNTDSKQILAMRSCNTTSDAQTVKTTIQNGVRGILNNYTDANRATRFTNIESGLKRAQNMLDGCNNEHKFVVMLSDGLPTTYCVSNNSYKGYVTYENKPSTNVYNAQNFHDKVNGLTSQRVIEYGTNYSDTGAIRAHAQADAMKTKGTKIFVIGAGLQTFGWADSYDPGVEYDTRTDLTGAQFVLQQLSRTAIAWPSGSTIENELSYSWTGKTNSLANRRKRWTDNKQAIAALHWEIGNYKGSYHSLYSSRPFENWLEYSIGSGEGYYGETNKASELVQLFKDALGGIKKEINERYADMWTVTDPMGQNAEFIGFYDKDGQLKGAELKGAYESGGENTAKKAGNSFTWRLQKSGYTKSGSTYTYFLKYRVRLTNEKTEGFTEGDPNNTNGKTTLTYQKLVNGRRSDPIDVDFPIPSVKGYLGELVFDKQDDYGNPVEGAVFTLTHACEKSDNCKGTATASTVGNNGNLAPKTAKSDKDGKVTFTNIPSGHKYTLVETTAPHGYDKDNTTYHVTVSYDTVTHDINNGVVVNPVKPYDLTINKLNAATKQPLEGAHFTLYSDAALKTRAKHPDGTDVADLISDNKGKANIGLLKNGTYYLVETESPEGFTLPTGAIVITIDNTNTRTPVTAQQGTAKLTVEADLTTLKFGITVPNNPGVTLPKTGGPGTTVFTITGAALCAAALVTFEITSKRRQRREVA